MPIFILYTRNMIYKQHREIETSLSLVLCCLFSYSKISKRLEGVAYKLLLINHTACISGRFCTLKIFVRNIEISGGILSSCNKLLMSKLSLIRASRKNQVRYKTGYLQIFISAVVPSAQPVIKNFKIVL